MGAEGAFQWKINGVYDRVLAWGCLLSVVGVDSAEGKWRRRQENVGEEGAEGEMAASVGVSIPKTHDGV